MIYKFLAVTACLLFCLVITLAPEKLENNEESNLTILCNKIELNELSNEFITHNPNSKETIINNMEYTVRKMCEEKLNG